MTYTKTQGKTLNLNEQHRSDGRELMPAEAQAHIFNGDAPVAGGYTIDEEGLINSYTIQPSMYPAKYPSPPQQRRYIFLGVGATLLVATLIIIASTIH